jgi:hypothetical protein
MTIPGRIAMGGGGAAPRAPRIMEFSVAKRSLASMMCLLPEGHVCVVGVCLCCKARTRQAESVYLKLKACLKHFVALHS